MATDNLSFEIMCIGTLESTTIKTSAHLAHALMANGRLWENPSLSGTVIKDEKSDLQVSVNTIEVDKDLSEAIKSNFIIRVEGKYAELERFRYEITAYLKRQGFSDIYVLTDDVSAEIACTIYPKINRVENLLRRYLVKFFVTKIGPNWWKVTADSEMNKKVTQRKNNETVFSDVIDNKAYLVDFGELGKMVYLQSSGYISRDDIVNRIMSSENSVEALTKLKQELQNNYTKFFKEAFKDKGFQEKWEKLEKIRHKTAHNNLFVQEDLNNAESLTDSLIEIISEANRKIDEVAFSVKEKEAIRENIVEQNFAYKPISDDELLSKLAESEVWAAHYDGFVGLQHFVKTHLGGQGYDFSSSFDAVNRLRDKGVIEVYQHESSKNPFPVTALRRTRLSAEDGAAAAQPTDY